MSPGQRRRLEVAAVVLLLALGFGLQARFFLSFPQAPLFGDSAGYYWAGQQVRKAAGELLHGGGVAVAIETVRPILHFLGVGALFALLDGDRPADLTRFRMLLGALSTFGMLGCYLLARTLAGRLAGLLALALAAVHPSLMMSSGRLYPEPVSATVLVWSAFLYARGVQRAGAALLAASGATLIVGLLFRPKLIPYLALLLALGSLIAWLRTAGTRRLVLAFAAGWLVPAALWVGAALAVAGPVDAKLPEYNLAWKQYYPYGFWQFLECDGWEGPYRLKTEPYYQALEAAAQGDPDLLRSRSRQYVFTLRYLVDRPADSALTMAASLWRLYNRPENPYRWDYPFDYEIQHLLQAVVALCAVGAAATLLSESLALAGVFFVPVSLWLLHGLAFSLPRYGVPPLLILIALAGAFLGWAFRRAAAAPRRALAVVAPPALASAVLFLLGAGLLAQAPVAARVLRFLAQALLVGLPLLLAAGLSDAARRWARGGFVVLALILLGHDLHDPRWHEVSTRLGGGVTGVSQEIALPDAALTRLRAASEAYLVFDLSVPRGDTGRLSIEVDGRGLPGTALVPTMLRLPEDTTVGGRDWRGYPQWWALRLTPELLPPAAAAPLAVRLTATDGSDVVVRGDRFGHQASVYEGPSFGDWPHLVPVKLQYDGDYRIPIRVGLGSTDSRSGQRDADGKWEAVRSVHRIRVVTLAQNEGYARFESDPLPAAPAVAVAFAALSGSRRRVADLLYPGGAFPNVPLGSPEDFQLEQAAHRLCYRAEGRRGERPYGSFFLIGPPPTPGRPLPLEVRFRTGMREEPAFFVPDRRRELDDLRPLLAACGAKPGVPLVRGVATVTDASHNQYPEDTGRWRVAEVY